MNLLGGRCWRRKLLHLPVCDMRGETKSERPAYYGSFSRTRQGFATTPCSTCSRGLHLCCDVGICKIAHGAAVLSTCVLQHERQTGEPWSHLGLQACC